jgi:hypothetical protein
MRYDAMLLSRFVVVYCKYTIVVRVWLAHVVGVYYRSFYLVHRSDTMWRLVKSSAALGSGLRPVRAAPPGV